MAIGKTAPNGTLNADGAFYSVQDVNVLLENAGGGGGGDLPTPTVADAGKAVVVDDEGKYALGEAGGGDNLFIVNFTLVDDALTADKTFNEILTAFNAGKVILFSLNGGGNIMVSNIGIVDETITSFGASGVTVVDVDSDTSLLASTVIINSDNTVNIFHYESV